MTFTLIIKIFNSQIISKDIPEWSVSDEQLIKVLEQHLGGILSQNMNIIFSDLGEIASLNMDYRGVEGPTDVLSFSYDDHTSPDELYISPQYISQSYSGTSAVEEILRNIVHGALHLIGETHESHFVEGSEEEMFKKQEKLLASIMRELDL